MSSRGGLAARGFDRRAQITKDPRVCGGKECTDDTRIRVIDIVQLKSEGYTPEQMQDVAEE